MGEVGVEKRQGVVKDVFDQYLTDDSGELTLEQLQILHGDLRIGGISLPQVKASIKYVCATETCDLPELYDLLREMDRRYFLVQDLRWEFSFLDRDKTDTISEEQAKWLTQSVHRDYFSEKKWEYFVRSRLVPGSGVSFPEIEVMLCDIPNRLEVEEEMMEQNRLRQEKLEKQKKLEEAAYLHAKNLARLRDLEKEKEEQERERQEEERRRKQREIDEREKQAEEERRRTEEEVSILDECK
ncbi:capping protein inhibiting regulator of actin dynamics [Patella vulgata]|uniref:capping protein inhibiting regulator of actin dynamics n=1 Tax=Patella vulgata TaxID=6465 RepID=UPI002180468E|nr:capping protein inhibiting regulator of actin dynamics [Patella vulgata]